MMKVIDRNLFAELNTKAVASPRGRSHHNLHPRVEDDIHRLVISAQPNSYVRPHVHSQPDKWELLVVLHGMVTVLTFSRDGEVTGRYDLAPGGELSALELPENTLHTFVVRQENSAVIEVKRGPYVPIPESDFASWAPAEGDPQAPAFLAWLKQVGTGDRVEVKTN